MYVVSMTESSDGPFSVWGCMWAFVLGVGVTLLLWPNFFWFAPASFSWGILWIFLKEFLEQPYRKRPELKQGLLVSAIEKGAVLDPYL